MVIDEKVIRNRIQGIREFLDRPYNANDTEAKEEHERARGALVELNLLHGMLQPPAGSGTEREPGAPKEVSETAFTDAELKIAARQARLACLVRFSRCRVCLRTPEKMCSPKVRKECVNTIAALLGKELSS
jgi:hypothetical protein